MELCLSMHMKELYRSQLVEIFWPFGCGVVLNGIWWDSYDGVHVFMSDAHARLGGVEGRGFFDNGCDWE